MGIIKGLKRAGLLERVANALGGSTDVQERKRQDPFWQMIASADQAVYGLLAEMNAEALCQERKRLSEIEKTNPGYKEELNRQRGRFGLPPL